jgi:hypothetical protein
MKRNYLGIDEVIKHYGSVYTNSQLKGLRDIPLSEEALEGLSHDHILVAGATMTILDVRKRAPKDPAVFSTSARIWYGEESFASHACVRACWYLVRKEPLAGSIGKTMAEQQLMLSSAETMPRACDFVYAVLLHFLATRERLFEDAYCRCWDVDLQGERVCVGHFDTSLGLRINAGLYRDTERRDNLGVTPLRII